MRNLYRQAIKEFGPVGLSYVLIALSAWILLMICVPQLIMIDYSLHPLLSLKEFGGPKDVWTLKNYVYMFTNALHRTIFIKTIWSSVLVTLTALVLCYPISFYLAKVAQGRRAGWLMVGLIIPYWINELLRLFAWQLILSGSGILNHLLLALNVIGEPAQFFVPGIRR